VRELARLGFVNAPDVIDMDNATVKDGDLLDDTAAIMSVKAKVIKSKNGDETVEREVRLYDKPKALELLGKHMGMFEDKLRVSGEMAVQIVDDIPKEPAKE
jgi:phage terminase small subunit